MEIKLTQPTKDFRILSEWADCVRFLPFKDAGDGLWKFLPNITQRRLALISGRKKWQYREREETIEEWGSKQW